ncbi:hypothetical protein F5884DRAFT_859069 [Xylogone sp. PMI_703]|nr:hypothetical protein F5884DRAFT_859069 [Xylogone sp. PMI_703]
MLMYNYLVPALYLNVTVSQLYLGTLNTGSSLVLGHIDLGTLRSEPGFEPHVEADVLYGDDYPTIDPSRKITRTNMRATIQPRDDEIAFQMQATGIEMSTPDKDVILAAKGSGPGYKAAYGSAYAVWTVSFFGGGEKYAALQDGIFVASEALTGSANLGEFYVALKISKVYSTNTSTVIGNDFP